jgi:hypothetical protein
MWGVNSIYLINITHKKRLIGTYICFSTAFFMLAMCTLTNEKWGFFVSLLACMIIGCATSIGENVVLGFMKAFPSNLVGGWYTGTGGSGIFSATLYLIMRNITEKDAYVNYSIIYYNSNLYINK